MCAAWRRKSLRTKKYGKVDPDAVCVVRAEAARPTNCRGVRTKRSWGAWKVEIPCARGGKGRMWMFSVCRFWNNTIVRIINTSILGFFLHCFLCGQWLASAWLAGWFAYRVSWRKRKDNILRAIWFYVCHRQAFRRRQFGWQQCFCTNELRTCVCVHFGCVFGERFFSYCNPRPPRQAVAAGPFIIISRELWSK